MKDEIRMDGVSEYCEGLDVFLSKSRSGRFVVKAYNEAGYNSTEVDLLRLRDWVKKNFGKYENSSHDCDHVVGFVYEEPIRKQQSIGFLMNLTFTCNFCPICGESLKEAK